MNNELNNPRHREILCTLYRDTLLHDVLPFWLKHGMDREFDDIITSLDRDGAILDTDKSIWFQGRAAWNCRLYARLPARISLADGDGLH